MARSREAIVIDDDCGKESAIQVQSCCINGLDLLPGITVEYQEAQPAPAQPERRPFLKIETIVHNVTTGCITLRGWLFRRSWTLGVILKGNNGVETNSVCLILDLIKNGSNEFSRKGMTTILARSVVAVRQLEITNALYPCWKSRGVGDSIYWKRERLTREGKLVCRWVWVRYFDDQRHKTTEKFKNTELRRPFKNECTPGRTVNDSVLFKAWRNSLPTPCSVHTFADGFCGAGGTSQGAADAGMKVKVAFDSDERALSTYRMNRRGVDSFHAKVDDFITIVRGDIQYRNIDVLHISSPCQWCSSANTRGGRNDEDNRATMFAAEELVENLRPRVVTLEQTDGIFFRYHEHFLKLLSLFTKYNYSIRSTIMQFKEHGMCQSRSRLILFAACPGATLPEFPEPTYGTNLSPYKTIADVLLPLYTASEMNGLQISWHEPRKANRRDNPPYSPESQVQTITTIPSNTYHYSGLRDWTCRELALLQGFPVEYRFPKTLTPGDVKRQIGNAVPPVIAKCLFEMVNHALETDDQRLRAEDIIPTTINCDN